MNITARTDIVILTRGQAVNKTSSGLYIAAAASVNQFGTVYALGDNRLVNNVATPWDFAVGDQVVVGANPMNTVTSDGVDYEFFRSKDIIGVLEVTAGIDAGEEVTE